MYQWPVYFWGTQKSKTNKGINCHDTKVAKQKTKVVFHVRWTNEVWNYLTKAYSSQLS